ncbi:L-rhamnose mutarotase [Devosia rhodophyticola]|uniref:L-rhamnose mutarotase n=1 Tax=Devosia rhodophyticola TaxID=3026423 RepID=A0ABY7YTX1_9HYPH|nr:L-rhamnose mutarotase [Devosia rhodophyticola]WDR04652.1 L-rhamnose mutarotase [Devosia rhodophyticola]
MQRFGQVIGLREERRAEYVELHAGSGVRDVLHDFHIRNFNIFVHQMPDGKLYEFAYFEYVGNDYEADMRAMALHPRTKAWRALCDPMQVPLPGETSWARMECVFLQP